MSVVRLASILNRRIDAMEESNAYGSDIQPANV